MNLPIGHDVREAGIIHTPSPSSALSWGAVLAGAAAAAALSLILLALGVGLGVSSISPWAYQGASASTLAVGTVVWLLITSLAASGIGGYIAGRLRSQWHDSDGDEAHFRDTAHGFLAWAVATLFSAAILTSAATAMLGTAAKVGAAVAATTGATSSVAAVAGADPFAQNVNYFVDMMFRGPKPADGDGASSVREARGIVTASMAGEMSQGDKAYLGQMVASRTGLSPADAEQRVTQTVTAAKLAADAAAAKAKEVAEAARKATAYTALWIFVSLLVGAFYSSLAATWGGRQRDPHSYLRRVT